MSTSRKILVIDDNIDMGEYICAVASQLGFRCTFTASADEFLASHCSETSLLFVDLIMPQVDGVQLLRQLAERHCSTPIVLMSGVGRRVMETAEELAQELGLNIVANLQKPFAHADLKALLERPLATGTAQAPAPTPIKRCSEYQVTEDDLLAAIAAERDHPQFVVYYQPQIEISTGRIAGLEALVRWQHPTAGLIFPDSFIPMLEAMGSIDDLGWIVTRRSLSELHLFADAAGNLPTISINCSVGSLLDLQFPDLLLALADEYRVPPSRITLEITESGLLRELAKTLDVLTRLRMKGIQLSIDDFGAGYSMMRQLRNIPATEIKIDKFFIQNYETSEADRIILRKTIEMGRDLGLTVVAEGIETARQLDFIRTTGCQLGQGYLFTRPIPTADMVAWLDRHRGLSRSNFMPQSEAAAEARKDAVRLPHAVGQERSWR